MTIIPLSLPAPDQARILRARRVAFLALAVGTYAILAAMMGMLLAVHGWSTAKIVMYVGYLLSLPWTVLGFWNSIIGLAVTWTSRDPARAVNPTLAAADGDVAVRAPVHERVALAICVRNEDFAPVERRIATMRTSLDATGQGSMFDIFVLSDSSRPDAIAAEEAAILRLRKGMRPGQFTYRRRAQNTGFKAGNIQDFLERFGANYPFFVPLDADSLMTGPALVRLARIMQASPRLGILQSLVVGLPATGFFTRLFQFGMRHGMRCYTIGGAWWQGDCGPYWGHNAIIRTAAFRDHCRLPMLKTRNGEPTHILSHDQVEAVLMRRAGYEVRVIADEFGSFEENPPALPDFIKRDLRWCQGNMQYWPLLAMPGLKFMSRVQLLLAIMMYLAAPGWMAFIVIGASRLFAIGGTEQLFGRFGAWYLIGLFAMSLTPKIAGLLDVMSDRRRFAAYGGPRLIVSALVEFVFSTLLAPAISVAETIFMIGLAFGRRIGWDAQNRGGAAVPWGVALKGLWPQTLFGLGLLAWLAYRAPSFIPWMLPVLISTVAAIPFAVLTAWPPLGRFASGIGLGTIPEEQDTPWEVTATLTEMPVLDAPDFTALDAMQEGAV